MVLFYFVKEASSVYSTSSRIIWWWPLCFGNAVN